MCLISCPISAICHQLWSHMIVCNKNLLFDIKWDASSHDSYDMLNHMYLNYTWPMVRVNPFWQKFNWFDEVQKFTKFIPVRSPSFESWSSPILIFKNHKIYLEYILKSGEMTAETLLLDNRDMRIVLIVTFSLKTSKDPSDHRQNGLKNCLLSKGSLKIKKTVPLPPPTISISLFFNQVGMWIWSSSLNISFLTVYQCGKLTVH